MRKRFNRFYRFSGGGAAHKNIEAPRSIHNVDARRLAFQSLATHSCFQTSNGMKESEEMRLKSTICESTLSTADAVPLPRWGRQISSGYAAILADGIPVRKAMTKLCIKIFVDADSAMESAFP